MRNTTLGWLALVLAVSPAGALAQESRTPQRPAAAPTAQTADPSPHPGAIIAGQVFVGERAPDFVLDASSGVPVKLSSLRGDWVLMVFADRKEDLAPLRQSTGDLRPLGMRLVGICNEKARTLETYNARNPLPFPMLADVTGEISAMYGLYDHARSSTRPGFLVLDRDGVVRMAVLGQQLPVGDITRLAQYAITGL